MIINENIYAGWHYMTSFLIPLTVHENRIDATGRSLRRPKFFSSSFVTWLTEGNWLAIIPISGLKAFRNR
jgi:hypothetical protein